MHVLEITTVGGSAGIILNKEVMAHWGYGKAIPNVSPRQRRDSEAYEAKLGRDASTMAIVSATTTLTCAIGY